MGVHGIWPVRATLLPSYNVTPPGVLFRYIATYGVSKIPVYPGNPVRPSPTFLRVRRRSCTNCAAPPLTALPSAPNHAKKVTNSLRDASSVRKRARNHSRQPTGRCTQA